MFFLLESDTWDLMPRPPDASIAGSKWVFLCEAQAIATKTYQVASSSFFLSFFLRTFVVVNLVSDFLVS